MLAKSAFYGQMDEGRTVTAPRMSETSTNPRERIEVGRTVHEVVQEEHSRRNESFTVPLGDAVNVTMSMNTFLDWLAEPSAKERFKKSTAEKAKAEGKTAEEVRKEADAAGGLVDKIEKQIEREDTTAQGAETSVEPSQEASSISLDASSEIALKQHLEQEMMRDLLRSDNRRGLQQQLHEDYIIRKISELQYSSDRATDGRRLAAAMRSFVAECGEVANKFISGIGVVLGCPQTVAAMPVLIGGSLITEISTTLLMYAANNPEMYQKFATQLWKLGGFAYDLYQKGNGVISERRRADRGSSIPKGRSGGSGGGTIMPEPEDPKKERKEPVGQNGDFWKSMDGTKAEKMQLSRYAKKSISKGEVRTDGRYYYQMDKMHEGQPGEHLHRYVVEGNKVRLDANVDPQTGRVIKLIKDGVPESWF